MLTVACDSAVLAQELDLMSELVVARLNEALGRPAVTRLRTRATRTLSLDICRTFWYARASVFRTRDC